MLNTDDAVTILRSLRPHTAVTLPDGSRALVMCQLREKVTVMHGSTVLVVDRWECEPVEFTDEDERWFRRPAKEVV